MFVPGHQVHSDIAAAKGGWHAIRRQLAASKVKEGSRVCGSSRFPSGCPGPCLVSGCRVRPGLHLGLGGFPLLCRGRNLVSGRTKLGLGESDEKSTSCVEGPLDIMGDGKETAVCRFFQFSSRCQGDASVAKQANKQFPFF